MEHSRYLSYTPVRNLRLDHKHSRIQCDFDRKHSRVFTAQCDEAKSQRLQLVVCLSCCHFHGHKYFKAENNKKLNVLAFVLSEHS